MIISGGFVILSGELFKAHFVLDLSLKHFLSCFFFLFFLNVVQVL